MSDEPLPKSEIILYQTEDGRTRIQCRFENETLWMTQALMAELFQVTVPTVNEHLKGIFAEGELPAEATIRKFRIVRFEGARQVTQMREGQKRGKALGLTDDEVAFYDALEVNDSAVKVLGEPTLKTIARELVAHVRKSVTIDWTLRESAQAQIRVLVRRILRKYGYPPDKQEKATQTVLEQAKLLCGEWVA